MSTATVIQVQAYRQQQASAYEAYKKTIPQPPLLLSFASREPHLRTHDRKTFFANRDCGKDFF